MEDLSNNKLKFIIEEVMDTSSESDEDEIFNLIAEEEDGEEILVEVLAAFEVEKRNSINKYLEDVVSQYTDDEFRKHFRISKELYLDLCKRFEESEEFNYTRLDMCLKPEKSLAIFLWFAGHEACSFRDLSDRFNVSISTVSRTVDKVIAFISNLSPEVIKWPTEERKKVSATYFGNKCGFSKAIGCIDGTHIVIDPPSKSKDEYIDRKGNVTLCMQGVCDENRKFINIYVGFPGSCHDSWVLKNSPLYQNLRSACGDFYLLGDSAYPCTKHLVTPYKDNGHLTRAQKNFNLKLSSGRVRIEHAFGILKQRFRQLYYCKLRGIPKLCHFIRACCVLHNLANENEIDFVEQQLEEGASNDFDAHFENLKGNAIRDPICIEILNHETNFE